MIVGRKKEIEELQFLFASPRPEFLAVYGRRRVGKTYLIDQVYGPYMAFRHAGREPEPDQKQPVDKMQRQLDAFLFSLIRSGMKTPPKKLRSWAEAFLALERFLDTKDNGSRYVVFIDEMPWMDTPRSSFLSELGSFWNNYACRHDNLILVACGSASSWILDNLIMAKKSLYGRVTHELCLGPLNLSESRELLRSNGCDWTEYEVAETYMALGGIPHYLSRMMPNYSFSQNIDRLFFGSNANYRDEFDTLFQSQFTNPEAYQKLIETLSTSYIGLDYDSISKESGIPSGGTLTKMLHALIRSAFVIKHVPFGKGKSEAVYRLIDPFCLFYLKQVRPNKEKEGYWTSFCETPKANTWRGLAFEILCFNHLRQIRGKLGILGIESQASMLYVHGGEHGSGAQIDMVIARKDRVVNLCEMKHSSGLYSVDKSDHLDLQRRKEVLSGLIPKHNSIMCVLVTTFGMRAGQYRSDYPVIVTFEDLFQ